MLWRPDAAADQREHEALVEAWPGPVFYDLGTFWMVTCGARVEFFLEGGGIDAVDSDRFFLRDASDDPDAPVVCYVDYLTITLDPASSSVTSCACVTKPPHWIVRRTKTC